MTTISEWAVEYLTFLAVPITADKVQALCAWHAKEGGSAQWNPLNTTEPAEGATDYNTVGVKNYPSMAAGIEATAATLCNGHYPNLLHLFEGQPAAMSIASCLPDLNIWGTGTFTAEVESIQQGDPHGYTSAEVAGSAAGGDAGPAAPGAPAGPAPAPPPPMVSVQLPQLQQGHSGQAVRSLQVLLNERAAGLAVDGSFGPATEAAVRNFQTVLHLTVDGIVGTQTWGALVAV